ncbi:hypothetical protein AA0535_0825 [Asaia krungthepensis NRIC 0535]|uniref:Uncharacterized protein n=1 Tax=Asaia krungthepensis NRIC 0535 TaxID=1307925 RepID=A0ABQ0PZU8_9PROT|nr:hypothetical protein AA0535_0825 [Asaia krungthepensis NRIC 0535]
MAGDGRIRLIILKDLAEMTPDMERYRNEMACLAAGEGLCAPEGTWRVFRQIAPSSHRIGVLGQSCVCCRGPGPVPAALNQIFIEQVRGLYPAFHAVVLTCGETGVREMHELLQQDALVRARYRF